MADTADRPGSSSVYRRLRTQLIINRALLALVALALCGAGGLAWGLRRAPQHLDADGFSFDVCYLPGLEMRMACAGAEPGMLALLDGAPNQRRRRLHIFAPGTVELLPAGAYAVENFGATPWLAWRDGRTLVRNRPQQLAEGRFRHSVGLRRNAPGAGPPAVAPAQELHFETDKERTSQQFAVKDSKYAALCTTRDERAIRHYVARFDAAGTPSPDLPLADCFLQGHAWRDGALTFANVTEDGRLLVYDFDRDRFVEDPARAPLAQQLRQRCQRGAHCWIADDFALSFAPDNSRLVVAADGADHVMPDINPLSHGPDGRPRPRPLLERLVMQKWVPQRVQLRYFSHTIKRALDADEEATEARYQQQRRRTRAEARRVAADRTGMMPIMQMLVDERTIAIVDMDYQRVTLLRCPGPPGAAPR